MPDLPLPDSSRPQRGARLLGHPIHPMLVAFPFALLSTSVVADVLCVLTRRKDLASFSLWSLTAGLVTGAAAAAFGLIDLRTIRANTRAHQIGVAHGLGNAVVLALFGLSLVARRSEPTRLPGRPSLVLSVAGAMLATVTAWLGGELVFRLGIGVAADADPDAPTSLDTGIRP